MGPLASSYSVLFGMISHTYQDRDYYKEPGLALPLGKMRQAP